jgi:hypothetical protein
MPEAEFGDQAAIIDPAGAGPRLYIQRVPEGKTAKNRVHLDVRAAEPGAPADQRAQRVEEHVARLLQAGAVIAWRANDIRGNSVVMRDPEGNEF